MIAFLGIDLCGADVEIIRPIFDAPLYQKCVEIPRPRLDEPRPGEKPLSELWDQLRLSLRLRSTSELAGLRGNAPGSEKIDQLLTAQASRLRDALGSEMDPGAYRAVVFPYRTPPYLRLRLPRLFGQPAAGEPPPRTLVAVEAPAALAIEIVARRACELPANLLLVTGTGPARELSVATAEVRDLPQKNDYPKATLVVRIRTAFQARTAADVAAAAAAVSRELAVPPDWDGWRFGASGPADDIIEALAFPESRCCDLGGHGHGGTDSPLGLGAIRFAGLRKTADYDGLPMLGEAAEAAQVFGSPHSPLGVAGVLGEGNWWWHRLVAANADLPIKEIVQSSKQGPERRDPILLAECLNPSYQHHRWLSQDEWDDAQLSLHDYYLRAQDSTQEKVPRPGRHAWIFEYQDRRPELPWGMPQWSIKYRKPT